MRLTALLARSTTLMLGFTGAALALGWWSNDRNTRMAERIDLAHQSLESHLMLRANVADLFKQYADALTIGDRDKGAGEAELKAAIWSGLRSIRQTVAAEIQLVGDEESEELQSLADIETTLNRQIAQIERIIALPPDARDPEELAKILDDGVDRDLAGQIEAALAHEAEEMRQTRAAAAAQDRQLRALLATLILTALAGTVALMFYWRNRMARPLARLLEGVVELSRGNFGHRMALPGGSEIAEVARVLDALAERVAARERTLSEQNAALEAAVAERTADLAQLLEEAKAKDQARRQMMADVSHELRTPLTVIIGESDIALRGQEKEPEAYREALARAREAAAHTSHLVDDLLFMARNEAGRPRLRLDNFELRPLLVQAVGMIDPALHVFSDLQPSPVRADRNRIRQAVVALVQNAKVHGGPAIRVRLLTTPRGYRIQVEDDGPGMPPEDRERAFTRYFRGSNAAERYTEGTGLGLPIVRAIAEAHGGGAWLSERQGGGTIAVIDLPRSPTRQEDAA